MYVYVYMYSRKYIENIHCTSLSLSAAFTVWPCVDRHSKNREEWTWKSRRNQETQQQPEKHLAPEYRIFFSLNGTRQSAHGLCSHSPQDSGADAIMPIVSASAEKKRFQRSLHLKGPLSIRKWRSAALDSHTKHSYWVIRRIRLNDADGVWI